MVHQIQNFEELATGTLRTDALCIAEAGLDAVDTGSALAKRLRVENDELHIDGKTFALSGRRIYFVGVGKCAFAAAETIEKIFGDRLTGGVALDVSSVEDRGLKKIEQYAGTHPLPSEANEAATKRIVSLLSDKTEDDLVLMLISGGGSVLLCLPPEKMTCLDESALFSELTAKGATIQDINTVRKHTSSARGGGLAAAAFPAEVISLIVSDVPGNDISFVASGPTMLDLSTIADAEAVFAKYGLSIPNGIKLVETSKEQRYFDKVTNILFLSSKDALVAMIEEARRRGYAADIADDHFTGEAREVGRAITEKLHAAPANTAFFYAGESTVSFGTIRGEGGRNQEIALSAIENIRDNELLLSFASDGHDNTNHAGAIADTAIRDYSLSQNLSIEEYLNTHSTYDFFTAVGGALTTGYTGSNVSDLIVALKK